MGLAKMASSAARPAPVRCVCQVWPPSCVAKMLPRVAGGPTVFGVDEMKCVQRRGLAGCGGLPGLAVVGGVEDAGAGRAGDPDVWAFDGDGLKVEVIGGCFGERRGRRLPTVAEVAGCHQESAVADGPAAGWGDESHRAERT